MDILTYALAKSYTDKALLGVGTIKGAPCTVKSQTEDDEYVYVTLGWENNLGTSEETVVKIKKGADGAPGEPGPAGDPGPQGVSITKIEKIKTEGLIDTYQISFSDNTTFEYTVSNGSDAVIDDNKAGLTKTFSSDKITKTFATLEEVNKRIPQHYVLPTPTEACNGQVVQFIGITTEDYVHNYFYECVQVEGSYRWVNTVVQNVPTKVSELTNDSNFVTETELNEKGYLTEHQDISGKVDKEEGKSLIADSEITRLSTVKNYDDSVVKEDIATIKTDYATKTYVSEQIAAADHLKREIVTEVPTAETAVENVIYMLKVESTVGADKYKEYMLIDGEVACVGDTSVDLTDYAKKDEIPTELPANGGNADTAASVPWSGITEKPSSYTPSSHKHAKAEITDFPSSMPASDVPAWAKESTKPSYTKAEVGLENVDNTADANKPVSTAQKEEFDKINSSLTDLKVSDFAGGKNLVLNTVYGFIAVDRKVNVDNSSTSYIFYAQAGKTYSFSGDATPTAQGVRFAKVSSISPETQEAVSDFNPIEDGVSTFTTNETGYYMLYVYNTKTSGIKFQIEEGTTATEYEPHIPSVKMLADTLTADVASVRKDVDEIEETVSDVRKETTVNLLNSTLETTTRNGITCTNNGDGTYTLNGTATSGVTFSLGRVSLKANKSYKLIAQSPTDTSTNVKVRDMKGILFGDGTHTGATPIITPTRDYAGVRMVIDIAASTSLNKFIVKPLLTTNLDATYDDFVPYTGDTGKLNSDVADIKSKISQQSAKIDNNTANFLKTIHEVYSMKIGNSAVAPAVINDFKIDPGYRYLYIINGSGATGYEVGILMFINSMKFVPLSSSNSETGIKDSVSVIGVDIYIEQGQLKVSRSATNYASTCVIYKLG